MQLLGKGAKDVAAAAQAMVEAALCRALSLPGIQASLPALYTSLRDKQWGVQVAALNALLQLAVTGQAGGTRLPDLEEVLPTAIPAVIALLDDTKVRG